MIKRLKEEYRNKTKARLEFGNQLFEAEKGLFDYTWLMEDNPCREICITEKGVYADFAWGGGTADGIKMWLDQTDFSAVPTQILLKGFYEKDETNMAMKLISYLDSNAVIFDVGANLGWYGINIKKKMPESTIYFFEPIPETANRLKDNLALNDIRDCYVINAGLLNKNEDTKIYYDITESGASSLADLREKSTTRHISCKMQRMDDFVKANEVSGLDFIKCDVEGTELFVYEGGKETIDLYKPIIMSEMLRKWARKFNYHPNDIIDFLSELGYQCFVVVAGTSILKKFDRVTEETIETNYYFMHRDKHAHIIKQICKNQD